MNIKRQHRLIFDTFLLGVVGALSAQAFMYLLKVCKALFLGILAGYSPPGLPSEGGTLAQAIGPHGLWLIPLSTTLGGLISGLLVYSLAPEAEGHGTDTAVHAFHQFRGLIRSRVPFVKLAASAITIGSGGAGGREGPTALISAGVGSIYGKYLHRPDEEVRLLALVGMASGLAAIFRSPIGTAIFAIEVLYGTMEFEAGALLYTMLGSIVAYAVNGLFVGFGPLFQVPSNMAVPKSGDYLWYLLLGAACGLVATVVPTVFYGVRDAFHRLPIPPHVKPAIGGLGVGVVALFLPQVLAGGYGWIQAAIDGHLSPELLLPLVFAMLLSLSLTISSGGSGGVFAPSLYIGGMLGGFLAQVFEQPMAAFVVVGMAAVFAGAARVPIASLLMVTEMTGGYHMLVPAALAVILSYLVQSTLSSRLKYKSLYEAQVSSRADSPAHHAEQIRIALDLLSRSGVAFPDDLGGLELLPLLSSGVPINLPDGRAMRIGKLRRQSSCVGRPIRSDCLAGEDRQAEVLLVFRGDKVLGRSVEIPLREGDRLVVAVSEAGWAKLSPHLAPVRAEQA
jgi:CIC family chloride channel protein